MDTNQDIPALKQDIQALRQDIEKWKLDVELAISKGVEKHIKWTLGAVTLLSVFMGLLIHFS